MRQVGTRTGDAVPRVMVRVISLRESAERRARMAAQLDATGLAWRFYDAWRTPPAELPYDPARARIARGRVLTPGELGCFASHWALWGDFLFNHADDLLLVLEDDLLLDPEFFARLDSAVLAMGNLDYLRLYAKVPAGIRNEAPFLQRHIARFSGKAYGTQAYLLTRRGAARFRRSIRRVERPIDDEMDRFWAHGMPIRAVFPFPVMEVQQGSTIEHARRSLEPLTGGERARWLLGRGLEKARRLTAAALSHAGAGA
ncbi:glycosyltransferase family 25 protein [Sphingomonas sp. ac-8]|uniref:glycosyltransferase family 25 protein n=1 Tax=Sphingomonas sp. ac-8 TaxID=3242977 RepID=UPI003A80562E